MAFAVGLILIVTPLGVAVGLSRALAGSVDALSSSATRANATAGRVPDLDSRSKIFAADGTLLAILHGEENREPVRLADVPAHVRDAILAAEDRRFYTHDGVDPAALGRAFVVNARDGSVRQGGGTITMQLARNAYLHDRSKSLDRKWNEMLVARRLEALLGKDAILEQYLNTVYFGAGAYGIQVAAETYFGKSPRALTVGEAALLAGLIRAPEAFDVWNEPATATGRRNEVLEAMHRVGSIDERTLRSAEAVRIRFQPRRLSNGIVTMTEAGRSFVEYVKQALLDDPRLGRTQEERVRRLFSGGLRITTTLDLKAQRSAERSIREVLNQRGDPSAALVAIHPPTGEIRAMAGGSDPLGFNLAAQGRRQPGSAFKPFTLVAALEAGISAHDVYNGSAPMSLRLPGGTTWDVQNYEGSPGGRMTLLDATKYSVNAVYAQVAMRVGPAKIVNVAQRMGITSKLDAYPSISLGALRIGVSPLEVASAYATLANRGVATRPMAIKSIRDRSGRVVLQNRPSSRRALARDVADKATAVLHQVVTEGTGRRALRLGRPAAGKTGTTDEYRDSWFVGYTPQLATAVWLGYPKVSRPLYNIHGLPRVFGGSLPCEIWTRFMIAAHRGLPVAAFASVDLGGGSSGSLGPSRVPVRSDGTTTAPAPPGTTKEPTTKSKGKGKGRPSR